MVTARHLEATPYIGISPGFNILDPGSIHPERHLVLRLTRRATGMTADAFALVDQKSIIGHVNL
jgi:hypothetical protein